MGTTIKSSTKAPTSKASTRATTKSTKSAEPTSEASKARPVNTRRTLAAIVVAEALGWDPSATEADVRPWAAQFAKPVLWSTADDFAEILVSLAGPCAEAAELDPTDPDVAHAWALLEAETEREAFEAATRALLAKVKPAIDAWERIHLGEAASPADVRARFLNPRALPELREVAGAKWGRDDDDGSTPNRLPGRDSPRGRYVAEERPASGATTKATSRTSKRAA